MNLSHAVARCLCVVAGTAFVALLTGCAAALPQVMRVPSLARVAAAETPLVDAARAANIAPGESGVWPLMQGRFALDARLAMIENAHDSIDLQYYLIGNDSTGRPTLRALRDAAQRGVRVRLLVDDLYTGDLSNLLAGLAATANVEVRLFNPVVTDRASASRRLLAMALGFKRLNHRMHNKLFIADGAMAVVGGRNLADEYFLRGTDNNFIDFDVLLAGNVVPELSHWFDLYWNSTAVYPLQDIERAAASTMLPSDAARAAFDLATRNDRRPEPPMALDFFGAPSFSTGLAQHQLQFMGAEVMAFADSPNKIAPASNSIAIDDTLTHRYLLQLSDARRDAVVLSPYFIPGPEALARIGCLRADGVAVRVVTNSLAVSDEPLANVGLQRHQRALLEMGVDLLELSSERLKRDLTLKGLLGSSTGRLHAKVTFLDRRRVLVGSMNLDPRSSSINTEIGVRIDSARLAEQVLAAFKVDSMTGVYQVKLRPTGDIRWVAVDGDSPEEFDGDPDTSLWQRLRPMVLSYFVPESQL